jgi:hypothetical protein
VHWSYLWQSNQYIFGTFLKYKHGIFFVQFRDTHRTFTHASKHVRAERILSIINLKMYTYTTM